jgi:hypothetical protein
MDDCPRWIKVLRRLSLVFVPIMLFNCWNYWQAGLEEFAQVLPCSLVLVACTHLLWRAPYKKWTLWEVPFVVFSVALAGIGAFLFKPDDEEWVLGFQLLVATFAVLAVSYGFFCTGVEKEHPLREGVIEPTKRFSRIGIVGFDFGMVFSPFAFVYYLGKYYIKKP